VDDEAAQGGAALPGGSRRREHHTAKREIQVRAGSDDRGIVAAQLEKGTAEAPGDQWGYGTPHGDRSGGGDQRNLLVLHETLARDAVGETGRSSLAASE
jgi:hypothetical protein